MEPKSPSAWDKPEESAKTPLSPRSPKSPAKAFRLRFHRMLSAGSLKSSTSSSPVATPSPLSVEGKHYSYDFESVDKIKKRLVSIYVVINEWQLIETTISFHIIEILRRSPVVVEVGRLAASSTFHTLLYVHSNYFFQLLTGFKEVDVIVFIYLIFVIMEPARLIDE